jgi:hypothetical protein
MNCWAASSRSSVRAIVRGSPGCCAARRFNARAWSITRDASVTEARPIETSWPSRPIVKKKAALAAAAVSVPILNNLLLFVGSVHLRRVRRAARLWSFAPVCEPAQHTEPMAQDCHWPAVAGVVAANVVSIINHLLLFVGGERRAVIPVAGGTCRVTARRGLSFRLLSPRPDIYAW